MVDHCVELWVLYPSSTVGRCSPLNRYADDPQNLRIRVDGVSWLPRNEKRNYLRMGGPTRHTLLHTAVAMVVWFNCKLEI